MSRSLQYIGLNKYAEDFVSKAIRVEETEVLYNVWNAQVIGRRYYMPTPDGPNKEWYFEEVVQASPWSSGPMVFTNLKSVLVKECGQVIVDEGYFSWMIDPSLRGVEFDKYTGRYYV